MTPQCGICTAYRAVPAAGPGKGLCCLLPPVPICAGLMQPTQGLAGIRSGGPQPLMLNARPQVAETEWCAQFNPTPEAEEAAHAAHSAAIEAGVGAFREPRDVGPSEPWSGAREAVNTHQAECTHSSVNHGRCNWCGAQI